MNPISQDTSFQYLLALGSNIEPRLDYIRDALRKLQKGSASIRGISDIFTTEPIGAADQMFLNGALILDSPLSPQDLLKHIQEIERDLNRKREIRWGNRTIDIDILLVKENGGSFLNSTTDKLCIPHTQMHLRDFVLIPAAQIAGSWQHSPGVTVKTLRDRLEKGGDLKVHITGKKLLAEMGTE